MSLPLRNSIAWDFINSREGIWYFIFREGKHFYKFLVDGHWVVEETEPRVEREDKVWNVIEVKRSDFEVFDALACDSFSLKNSEKTKAEKNFSSDSWCQVRLKLSITLSPIIYFPVIKSFFSRCLPTLISSTSKWKLPPPCRLICCRCQIQISHESIHNFMSVEAQL